MLFSRRKIVLLPAALAFLYSAVWLGLYIHHGIVHQNMKSFRSKIINAAAEQDTKSFQAPIIHEKNTQRSRSDEEKVEPSPIKNSSDLYSAVIIRPQNDDVLWTEGDFECVAWRSTANCDPYGPREEKGDLSCNDLVSRFSSGYCEIKNKTSGRIHQVVHAYCGGSGEDFKCGDIAMEFANYKILADMSIRYPEQMPIYTPVEAPSRGIIIAAYKEVLINAYVNIRLLRHHGCILPIELWFKTGELSETDPLVHELVSNYDVNLRVIKDQPLRKWLVKIYSVFYSRFDEVLLLDADNVPSKDPTYLFDLDEFKHNSAIFWPDYWRPGASIFDFNEHSLAWEFFGIEPIRMFEQESGQVLINRRKSVIPLNLLMFYAYHFDLIEKLRLVWGDKDLFRLAWIKVKQSFHMIQRPPGSAGLQMGSFFCGLTMVQHDTEGNPIFFHRNTIKFSKDSWNKKWWTHLQQYVGVYDPMEFRVENTLRKHHPFGPFDCFGAYRYEEFLGTDGSRKFQITDMQATDFADLEMHALNFAREGELISGGVI